MDPATVIALLTASVKAGQTIFEFAQKVREHLRQNAELTPEAEAAFDEMMKERMKSPHWQPTPPPS